jgi:hypothetical protein
LNQPVKKCGFPHIWTSYYRYNIAHMLIKLLQK